MYLLVAYVKFLLRPPGRLYEQAVTGHGAGVSGSGPGVGPGGEKRAETGTKVETAELVRNFDYQRRSYRRVNKSTGLRSDQTIILKGPKSSKQYPDPLRRISYWDSETHRRLVFLTNNFALPALTIAELYRCRWRVELFFKWIKQHLRIKAFYGTSRNAVKTQIWIAITVYVLVAIVKKQLNLDRSLSEILQIVSVTLFEQIPIFEVLTHLNLQNEIGRSPNQLILFDF